MADLPRRLLPLGLLVFLAACREPPTPLPPPEEPTTAASIEEFFHRFTDDWVRRDPNVAVFASYFDGDERDRLSRQLTPVTRAFRLETIELARAGLAELETFDRNSLTPNQRLSADVMRWQIESIIDDEPYLDYDFPLEQYDGANVQLPSQLIAIQPVATARDAENYVARLREIDDRIVEAVAESRRQAEAGVVPPRFILTATIAQMRRFITPAPAENPLVTTLRDKTAAVAGLTETQRNDLVAAAAAVVDDEVYPAWQSGIATLEAQIPSATEEAGLARFERGAELYAERLRNFTTTELTADEIHAIGLAEVARIESDMDRLFRELGYAEGTIAEREGQLARDLSYPDTAEGRRQIMADIDVIFADALARTASSFDIRPVSAIIARPFPEFRWQDAAARYTPPPPDLSRPAVFEMPLRASQLTRFGLRTLVYHETVPGHHFQIGLSVENDAYPAFRRTFAFGSIPAATEGWALYAERFAAEDGWYDGDSAGRLGQLSDARWRAKRLVVDTGLHAKGWTREQAIAYGIEASEIDRYVVNPGQACAYMIGQLEIVRLRERARAELGERFAVHDFHRAVLGAGIAPLRVIAGQVDAYLAERSNL